MPDSMPQAKIVLTTAANAEEAGRLAHTLVEERLVACATMVPGVQSVYQWQGGIESATETLLLLKTGPDQLAALEARVRELHSYDTPEFLVLGVEAGSQGYLQWLQAALRRP
jgi:periplasmic divalent cation tolerance protein